MVKGICNILILLILCILFAEAAIYEARNSDDVEFFLEHNPEENGALLFYDPKQEEKDGTVHQNTEQILSIFKNVGEQGRSTEDWVDSLNDKVHLMKVNKTNVDSSRMVSEYKVGQTPLLILLDNGKVLLEEVVSDETYDHVYEIFQAKQAFADSEKAQNSTQAKSNGGWSSVDQPTSPTANTQSGYTNPNDKNNNGKDDNLEAIEASKKAQEAAEAAKKAAEDANRTLKSLESSFAQQKARQDIEDAKKKAEQAQKELEVLKKKIADHLADDKAKADKEEAAKNQTANANKNQQPEIEYVPIIVGYPPQGGYYQQPAYTTYQQPAQKSTSTTTTGSGTRTISSGTASTTSTGGKVVSKKRVFDNN